MMKFRILLMATLVSLTLFSCSSDSGSSSNSDAQFTDKWWYSADNSTTDVYFHSDGAYESTYTGGGFTLNSDGEWEWVNQAQKTYRIFNLTGNGASEFSGKVTSLSDHEMAMKISFDNGATYSDTVYFLDTND